MCTQRKGPVRTQRESTVHKPARVLGPWASSLQDPAQSAALRYGSPGRLAQTQTQKLNYWVIATHSSTAAPSKVLATLLTEPGQTSWTRGLCRFPGGGASACPLLGAAWAVSRERPSWLKSADGWG
ncbi:hypothetical protein Cadr_000007650 [Camelus dromedarius]|uniref:Uncharacterized protein n=1 Tax=Camelus dromedarius TaxID=9838 RepID=A0A5N4E5E8_CAMDR|nr:hypothetical protein Cadr_000007650 [Camelus dromedarius]